MRTKILIDFETFAQTAQMTLYNFRQWAKKELIELRAKESKKIRAEDIEWCDIVISIRGMSCFTAYIAKLCAKYKRLYIYEIDDNLFLLDRKDKFMVKRQEELQKVLNSTAILWTPNSLLAEYICSRSKVKRYILVGWVIHENDIYRKIVLYRKKDIFKIVYYSNDGSSNYFWGILENILPKIEKIINKKVVLEVIGMKNNNRKISGNGYNIVYVPHLNLNDFRKYLAQGNFDVGFAPLIENDGFSKYKYANKFFEFSMAGIMGIYSKCPPYTFFVKDRENGILADNTEESWLKAIKEITEDPYLSNQCINNAQKELEEQYSEDSVFQSFVSQVPELLSYRAPKAKIKSLFFIQIKYFCFRTLEKVYSFCLALMQGGIKEAFCKTKRFIRTMKQRKKELEL